MAILGFGRRTKVQLTAEERRLLVLAWRHKTEVSLPAHPAEEELLQKQDILDNGYRCESSLRKIPQGMDTLSLDRLWLGIVESELAKMQVELLFLQTAAERLRTAKEALNRERTRSEAELAQLLEERVRSRRETGCSEEEILEERNSWSREAWLAHISWAYWFYVYELLGEWQGKLITLYDHLQTLDVWDAAGNYFHYHYPIMTWGPEIVTSFWKDAAIWFPELEKLEEGAQSLDEKIDNLRSRLEQALGTR